MTKRDSTGAIVAADLHLLKKPGLWANRPEIAGDDLFALQQIVALAKNRKADLYLLGDILDSVTMLPRPLVAAKSLLEDLMGAGQKVFYIQGQHEFVLQSHNDKPWMSLIPGTRHLHAQAFDFLGLAGYALDYAPRAQLEEMFVDIPGHTQVLMLHGTVDTVMPFDPHFTAAMIPKHVQYVFAGDWHEGALVKLGEGRTLYYPGSPYRTAADEPDEKFVYHVTNGKDGLKVESVRLLTRVIMRVSTLLSDAYGNDLDKVLATVPAGLPDELKTPVFLVDVPMEPEDYDRLAEIGHIYTTAGANPLSPSRVEIEHIERLSNEEVLERYIDRRALSEEFDFVLDVIQNPVSDALKRLRDKLGIQTEDVTVAGGKE